jgi:hypothetical protein
MNMKKLDIIKITLEDLSAHYKNSRCNDFYIDDSEENRKLLEEYNVSIGNYSPIQLKGGKTLTDDFFGIYVIKKELGLI